MRLSKTALLALPAALLPVMAALPPLLASPASAATAAPWALRINSGGPSLTDSAGRPWIADRYYAGGTAATTGMQDSNTTDPALYVDERYGMTGYNIPVPAAGIYNVTLHLAENWATAPGIRVFSATAEGQTVISNLDLLKTIGGKTAYDVTVPVRTTDTSLDLGFSATADNAKVDGIEVVATSATAAPAATAPPTAAPVATASPTTAPPTTAPPATTPPPTQAPPATTPPPAPATNPWPLVGTKALYVSPTGSDNNSGTSSSPFRQVARAASVASPGTVVHVAPGTYGYVESTTSGSSGAPITFVSDSKWGAKISAPGSTNAWTNTGDYVVIQNFEIADSNYSGIMSTANHGKFLGNHIHHMTPPDCSRGGAGIELQNYSETDNDSIGNVIHDILVSGDCARIHGIYYQGPNGGRILNNIVYQTSGWGIHLWHNANHITISNNTVFKNLKGGMVIGGSLEGNDIAPGVDSGDIVTNNIVVNNSDWGIRELGRVGVNTYDNNLLNGNAAGAYDLNGGGSPSGTVTADPMFLNYQDVSGGDYHLRNGSPALDKGTTNGAPKYDLDLAGRPMGPATDIGAYEGGH
jgi:parallel beta-helix repeat protein